ncbi:MAG: hypothetical protein KIT35_23010 [Piscinibacter sp.]|uniref:hypothetical protein n=1 Tax=Piscinibacter sp. TaxID=1903157 RepID=UPI002589EC18|nr:hypothetical protein [Piscinibacter sp.]MCW5666713.1 hypothetical protein [Piscinibacter sp.]
MNSPTTGALLARDKIDRYRSYGAFGKPAYQSYVQMRAMLRSKKGERFANYFAKPVYDADAGELRWSAEVPGEVRKLFDLQGAEFEAGQKALDEIHRQLVEFVQQLRTQGQASAPGQPPAPGGAAAFASLLEQAMKVPGSGDFLFFVGDQPVIAFWGFTDPDGRAVDPALLAPRLAAAAPAPVEPLPAAVPVEEKRKRPWWWWLLWLLLALLLLALLLLLPRACVPGGGLDLKRAIPGLAPPDDAASEPPPERRAEGPGGPALPGAPGGPGGTGPDGGVPPGTPPGAEPPLPGASQPDLALPPEGKEPKTEPPVPPDQKEPPPEDKPPKTEPPPPPDPKTDPPKPPTDPKDPKGRTDPPAPPNPKDMKMPDDPNAQKKMDFLEGQWKAGEGLVDKRTQQPLDLGFRFGKDGQGEVSVRRPDGVVCQGPVTGRMAGGKLGIQGNQSIPCNDGSSYGAPKIECQKEQSGQTQCYGVNADGSRYYMGMKRQ